MGMVNQAAQVAQDLKRQVGFLKSVGDAVIRQVRPGSFKEVIVRHKSIEHLCTQYSQAGNPNGYFGKIRPVQFAVQDAADKSQVGCFAAQGTLADVTERSLSIQEITVEQCKLRGLFLFIDHFFSFD